MGDRLKIGDTIVLEITQIGKECHNSGCAIKKATGAGGLGPFQKRGQGNVWVGPVVDELLEQLDNIFLWPL